MSRLRTSGKLVLALARGYEKAALTHSPKWWDRLLPHSPGWSFLEEYHPTITHLGHGRPQFPPARTVKPVPHVRGREGSTWAACSTAGWRAPHRTGCGAAVPVPVFPHAHENSSGSVCWGSRALASVHRPSTQRAQHVPTWPPWFPGPWGLVLVTQHPMGANTTSL